MVSEFTRRSMSIGDEVGGKAEADLDIAKTNDMATPSRPATAPVDTALPRHHSGLAIDDGVPKSKSQSAECEKARF